MSRRVDIAAHNVGPFLDVIARTSAGMGWLHDNLAGDDSWSGHTLHVEHRFGPDLLMGAHQAGLVVSLDGRIADASREGRS